MKNIKHKTSYPLVSILKTMFINVNYEDKEAPQIGLYEPQLFCNTEEYCIAELQLGIGL
ncbi:MAG: hypothetical protein P0116_01840 [Candidatus Nitrosocosmicus sp.]|nr:hypothetical protein [Candidatus Nitrosocosmicus sp.]